LESFSNKRCGKIYKFGLLTGLENETVEKMIWLTDLLWTEITSEGDFSVFMNNLFVRVELGDEIAAVVALVALHGLGFQVACNNEDKSADSFCHQRVVIHSHFG
jgi:hypothetical protein